MKSKSCILSTIGLLFALSAIAQQPQVFKLPTKITIADTTGIKIKKLQDQTANLEAQNKKLQNDVALLKASLDVLTTKFNEVQKDNGASKLLIQGINNSMGSMQANINNVQSNLTSFQATYTNFTTVVYPNHHHILKGVAGNSAEKNGPVTMNVGNGDFSKMLKAAKKTSGVASDD